MKRGRRRRCPRGGEGALRSANGIPTKPARLPHSLSVTRLPRTAAPRRPRPAPHRRHHRNPPPPRQHRIRTRTPRRLPRTGARGTSRRTGPGSQTGLALDGEKQAEGYWGADVQAPRAVDLLAVVAVGVPGRDGRPGRVRDRRGGGSLLTVTRDALHLPGGSGPRRSRRAPPGRLRPPLGSRERRICASASWRAGTHSSWTTGRAYAPAVLLLGCGAGRLFADAPSFCPLTPGVGQHVPGTQWLGAAPGPLVAHRDDGTEADP